MKWNADVSEVPGFRSRFTNLQQSAHAHAHALKHNFTFSRKKFAQLDTKTLAKFPYSRRATGVALLQFPPDVQGPAGFTLVGH